MKNGFRTHWERMAASDAPYGIYVLFATAVFLLLHRTAIGASNWLPIHDTLTQFTEFLYALSAFRNHELPLWNSYLYGGQPFYLLLNHGLLMDPLLWIWMFIGTVLSLSPLHIFIFTHLTGIVFFAFGGMLFVKELTNDRLPAVVAYMILLFSGEACYWMNQVYSLAVVQYVPWVLYAALRYVREQTLRRAIIAALFFSIAANQYYPVYLITYVLTAGALILLFYGRSLSVMQFGTVARHALIVLPLGMLLILPTYLAYTEVNHDNYQLSRFQGTDQKEPAIVTTDTLKGIRLLTSNVLRDMFSIKLSGQYTEMVPFVGIPAILFMAIAAFFFSRAAWFWACLLVLTGLHFAGTNTPFYYVDYYVMPFYKVIRSFGFFSGYVSFSAAVLAGIGVTHAAKHIFDEQVSSKRGIPWNIISGLLFSVALVLLYPGKNTAASLAVLTVLSLVLFIAQTRAAAGSGHKVFAHLVVISFLIAGSYNMFLANRPYLNVSGNEPYLHGKQPMFTYGDRFNFSFTRPDQYTVRQLDFFMENSAECCITNHHLAEKIDGPFYFDGWGSAHTLFVDREYYRVSRIRDFDLLTRDKLHFFRRYAVSSRIDDYGALLDRSVLVLDRDTVQSRAARVDIERIADLPQESIQPLATAALNQKTANAVSFVITTSESVFMLYTDLYHEGFRAFIDNSEVPILKGMGVFKALELPAGKHTITFSFQPFFRYPLLVYLVVSVGFMIGQVFYAGILIWKWIRSRCSRHPIVFKQ